MLIGRVTSDKEAVLPIEVLGPEGQAARVEATIDTGYNGYLTLPGGIISELGLSFAGVARAALGDGSEVAMDLFLARVHWHAGLRETLVLEAEGGVLLGMAMLAGSRVTLAVMDGGGVSIAPL